MIILLQAGSAVAVKLHLKVYFYFLFFTTARHKTGTEEKTPLAADLFSFGFQKIQETCTVIDQSHVLQSIYLSINQSNFYSANIPGEARLSGATAESLFNTKIDEAVPQHQWAIGCVGVYGEKPTSKRCILRCFLKVATEMAEWTDSGRLFQRDRAQE